MGTESESLLTDPDELVHRTLSFKNPWSNRSQTSIGNRYRTDCFIEPELQTFFCKKDFEPKETFILNTSKLEPKSDLNLFK